MIHMHRVLIDGNKFLAALGLSDNITAELIAAKLMSMSEEERIQLEDQCVIRVDDCFPHFNPEVFRNEELCIPQAREDEYPHTEVELRRLIKYERNPMRKASLQAELSSMNSWNGKHRKGKKRR